MADDRLREAERQFRESGTVSDEARLLAERARASVLAPERLELASVLGYEPAVAATGAPPRAPCHSLRPLVESIERFGDEAIVRAALVVARRGAGPGRQDDETREALAAVEAWVQCPCDRHRALLEPLVGRDIALDAANAVNAALGRQPFAQAMRSLEAQWEPHGALVLAVKRELLRWALAPHEPRARNGATAGSLLELVIGDAHAAETTTLLVSGYTLRVGPREGCGLDLLGALNEVEIRRTGTGFDVLPVPDGWGVHVGEAPLLARRALASGDVLSLGPPWIEARLLEAPFTNDITRVREEAERLLAGLGGDEARQRIVAAAACGHAGAMFASATAGIALRPRFGLWTWVETLRGLPAVPVARASLAVAREAAPIWRGAHRDDASVARLLDGMATWVTERSDSRRARLDEALGEVRRALRRHDTKKVPAHGALAPEDRPVAAGYAVQAAGESVADADALSTLVARAVQAGVPARRVRALMEEELLGWALGS